MEEEREKKEGDVLSLDGMISPVFSARVRVLRRRRRRSRSDHHVDLKRVYFTTSHSTLRS